MKPTTSAIRFLYRLTLGRPWDFDEVVPSPKKPRTRPIILSPEKVVHFLGHVLATKEKIKVPSSGLAVSTRLRV